MRGTVIGESVVSRAETKEYDEGHERTFNKPTGERGGSWVWDPKANDGRGGLVRPWEKGVEEERRALDAPVMAGRFYENVVSPLDGHVFTSRADYQRYCRERGVTNTSDYDGPGGEWERAAKKREQGFAAPEHKKARQEIIGRRLYEVSKIPQAKYDRQVEAARRTRLERRDLADKNVK